MHRRAVHASLAVLYQKQFTVQSPTYFRGAQVEGCQVLVFLNAAFLVGFKIKLGGQIVALGSDEASCFAGSFAELVLYDLGHFPVRAASDQVDEQLLLQFLC